MENGYYRQGEKMIYISFLSKVYINGKENIRYTIKNVNGIQQLPTELFNQLYIKL